MYDGLAEPTGIYASRLEQRWHYQFTKMGWNARYIGDGDYTADFEVDGIRIEIKPDGMKYVEQAAMRCGNIIIISGSPGWCKWFFVDDVCTPTEMSPPTVCKRFDGDDCGRMLVTEVWESLDSAIKRNGFRFK